jgi:hypothetical protein
MFDVICYYAMLLKRKGRTSAGLAVHMMPVLCVEKSA